MRAKLINGQLEYFSQPSNILGDATAYAIEQGYKEVIYRDGKGGTYETETNIIIETQIPEPMQQTIITPLEFLNRFTDIELATIYTAAKTIIEIEVYLAKFNRATFIDLTDPLTITGVNNLSQLGLINNERINIILKIN